MWECCWWKPAQITACTFQESDSKKKKEKKQKSLLIKLADDTKIGEQKNNEEERSETWSNLNSLIKWK